MKAIQVLVIDDEPSIRTLIEKELASSRIEIFSVSSGKEALDIVKKKEFDVIILDIRLPDIDGMTLLKKFKENLPDVEIIIITGYATIEDAINAMKIGAYDYITKPFALEHLELLIEKAYQRVSLLKENRLLNRALSEKSPPQLIGKSKSIQEITKIIKKVAPSDVSVLLTGESGTGKDVVAKCIHYFSSRSNKPLIVKNCGEMQKELVRSELFGHVKGAFTGATQSHNGLIEIADGGTLFLDEVGELPLEVQSALLRFIETKRYRRVGDTLERKADVRLILATHRDLQREVETGNFLDALYYRINIVNIYLPPLKERKEDIPLLVEHFVTKLSPIGKKYFVTDEVMECLLNYNWPGNIRELRNVIERAIVLSENNLITSKVLPKEICKEPSIVPTNLNLYEMEKILIKKALAVANGNKSKASKLLGISRKKLYKKIKDYNL